MAGMGPVGVVIVGLVIAAGLVGIVVAVLPGLLLVWGAVAVWAFVEQTVAGWIVLALATLATTGALIAKYLVPGRQLRDAGVPKRTILVGAVAALIGFVVVPVVGLPLGFVVGVYGVERLRLRAHDRSWESTKHALKAIGLSVLIELGAGLSIAALWLLAVFTL
jgi:uncharacterized protein YqgC (DUF456 family)